jgi:hypothetical protein
MQDAISCLVSQGKSSRRFAGILSLCGGTWDRSISLALLKQAQSETLSF